MTLEKPSGRKVKLIVVGEVKFVWGAIRNILETPATFSRLKANNEDLPVKHKVSEIRIKLIDHKYNIHFNINLVK